MTSVSRAARGFASLLRHAVGLVISFLFPGPAAQYRPEDHYMRGPGPKWRAKQIADRASGSPNRARYQP